MATLPKLELRCPQELLDAAQERAASRGLSLADYVRGLIAKDTGTPVEVKRGFQAFSAEDLAWASNQGLKVRRKNAKKRKSKKSSSP